MEFLRDDMHVSEDEETNVHISDKQPNSSSDQFNLQDCLLSLQQNVKEAKSAIYVRLKLL